MDTILGSMWALKMRFFPPINANLYDFSLTKQSELESAFTILKLAKQPFNHWQRWTGLSLDAKGKLGRLLWMHQSLIEEELNGHWQRANFYWREIVKTIKKMNGQKDIWKQLDKQFLLDADYLTDNPDGLRYRILVELLIDSNRALFNGRVSLSENKLPDDRALVFAERIKELLPLVEMKESERWYVADHFAEIIVETYRKKGKFQQAIKTCEEMVRKFPEQWKYQDILVSLETQSVLNDLDNQENSDANARDAHSLYRACKALTRIAKDYPYNPTIYDSLGLLSQIRAVKLANSGDIAEALLAVEESLTYLPGSEQTLELREQLRSSMQALQSQIAQVEAELAQKSGATLNSEGERLRAQARQGTKSADKFIKSRHQAKVLEKVWQAQAVRLWLNAGLGGTTEKIVNDAITLYEALLPLFNEPPKEAGIFREALLEITTNIPQITPEKFELLKRYLERRLFEIDAEIDSSAEQNDNDEDSPILLPQKGKEAGMASKEPVGMWLFGTEALGVKSFALISLAMLMVSGGMLIWNTHQDTQRDEAYAKLIKAAQTNDAESLHHAAESFWAAKGFTPDERDSQVAKFMELPNLWLRDAAFVKLQAALKAEKPELVMDAAEAFLTAPPIEITDERQIQVLDVYDTYFVIWFVALDYLGDEQTQKRLNTYKMIATNTEKEA